MPLYYLKENKSFKVGDVIVTNDNITPELALAYLSVNDNRSFIFSINNRKQFFEGIDNYRIINNVFIQDSNPNNDNFIFIRNWPNRIDPKILVPRLSSLNLSIDVPRKYSKKIIDDLISNIPEDNMDKLYNLLNELESN